jgi:phosphatidylglycerophosphate synthase
MSCLIITREFWVSALRDFNSRNMNVSATKVTFIAKLKTTIQFIAIFLFLTSFYFGNFFVQFIANFVLFLSLILSIQSALKYSIDTFKQ